MVTPICPHSLNQRSIIFAADDEIDRRMMLDGCIYRGEERIFSDMALNDVVINRNGALRIILHLNHNLIIGSKYNTSLIK